MNAPSIWSRILLAVGLAAMLVGLIDPLEGSFVILAGTAVASAGGMIGGSRYRLLIYSSFVLVALGVVVMVVLSVLGGIGGNAGRSMWWGLLIVPYPIGWMAGVVGAAAALFADKTAPNASGSR